MTIEKDSVLSTGPEALARRTVLKRAARTGAALAVGVVGLSTDVMAQAKTSQKSVAYQDSPKGDQKCENCKLFEAPNGCKTVQGPIAAQGWCKIWVKKA